MGLTLIYFPSVKSGSGGGEEQYRLVMQCKQTNEQTLQLGKAEEKLPSLKPHLCL